MRALAEACSPACPGVAAFLADCWVLEWLGSCRVAGLLSEAPISKIKFHLQTGSESRLPPGHPSDVDSQGGLLAAAGRALRGRGSGQVGTLAPSREQGL